MKFLSVDTSTQYSVVVLSDENGMLFGERRLFEKGRCENLFSLIRYCLKTAKTNMEGVDFFAVGCGPGSFTGLRIGIAAVKGLSYALNKNCFVFSSLDAVAFNEMALKKDRLCVCVDAKRDNIYCRFYAKDRQGGLVRDSDDLLLGRGTFLKKINVPMALTGDALKLPSDIFLKKIKSLQLLDEKFWYPTPESLSKLTLESFKKGEGAGSFVLDAKYLYESDCQVHKSMIVSKKKL